MRVYASHIETQHSVLNNLLTAEFIVGIDIDLLAQYDQTQQMLSADLARLPVDDRFGRVAGDARPGPACLFVCLAHGAGYDSGVIHQQPVTTDFEQMPDDRLRLLIDAHALPVDVLRHVVESARHCKRWPGAEYGTDQTVFRAASGVVEHRALLVVVVASLVFGARIRRVRARQVQIAGGLDGLGALADVSHQTPAGFSRREFRALESYVAHRANPILIEVAIDLIG